MSKISPVPPENSPPTMGDKGDNVLGFSESSGSGGEAPHRHDSNRGSIVEVAVNEWRHFLHWSGWYDSALAISIRRFLRGQVFAVAAMVCLFLALFISDLFTIGGVEENTILDVILMLVLFIFAFEFFGLAATDPSYMFSFFFWMDLLGTLSMIFDISFMLGSSATEPEKYTGAGAEENVIVVRAARATKLGARAGRLSRVMKLLRFLPFVSGAQESDVKMARVISNQLTNVLSTRVAFLVICIVVVLPIFGMFTYPEVDDSMRSWAEVLATNAKELSLEWTRVPQNLTEIALSRTRLHRELDAFALFYKDLSYGPFAACYGVADDVEFRCMAINGSTIQFNTTFHEPGRRGFIRTVSDQGFFTAYDLSTPKRLESVANCSLIVFIIIVMIVFGLLTSNSITVIALHPLERMLSVVRERCQQIFKYTDSMEEENSDSEGEEYDDAEHESEFALLEKVVAKLAAIASLSSTKDEPEAKENMTEDEIMALNWAQGQAGVVPRKRISLTEAGADAVPSGDAPRGRMTQFVPSSQHLNANMLDDIPSDVLEALDTNSFCTIDLVKGTLHPIAAHIVLASNGCSAWVHENVDEAHIFKFVRECESKYNPNPFHSFAHALDVQYAAARSFRLIEAEKFMSETSQFSTLIAAIAHDLGHLGVNNQYLIETSHELALKYNDRSPLENMHCASLFQVVADPTANVFAGVEKDTYKEMRKGIINAILHTDVTKHQEMMKELTLLYQMNSEVFDEGIEGPTPAIVDVLQNNTQLTLNAMLHCSDVGNPMKPWEIAQRLAHLCVDEFFAQGDCEKAAGIPVQMLNDRDKVNRPNSQIGFIEFVIAPMVEGMVRLFPPLDDMADNLGTNITHWFDVWVGETSPAPEVKAKTEARVGKVASRCKAVMRAGVFDSQGSQKADGAARISVPD